MDSGICYENALKPFTLIQVWEGEGKKYSCILLKFGKLGLEVGVRNMLKNMCHTCFWQVVWGLRLEARWRVCEMRLMPLVYITHICLSGLQVGVRDKLKNMSQICFWKIVWGVRLEARWRVCELRLMPQGCISEAYASVV